MNPADAKPPDEPALKRNDIAREMPAIASEDLMQGANELRIVHRGEVYRLRITRAGKLILHK